MQTKYKSQKGAWNIKGFTDFDQTFLRNDFPDRRIDALVMIKRVRGMTEYNKLKLNNWLQKIQERYSNDIDFYGFEIKNVAISMFHIESENLLQEIFDDYVFYFPDLTTRQK